MGHTITRTKGGASIRATGKDAQKLFDMMTSKQPPFDSLTPTSARAAGVTTGPVSGPDAVRFASELDAALLEVMNGERKSGNLPIEPMARLMQFARDAPAREKVLVDALNALQANPNDPAAHRGALDALAATATIPG